MSKQTIYNVGIYVRLSQEDMRAGESLSIENQKLILTKYVTEQGWNIYDIYIDDGFSGTDFNRPGVSRLLEDAKAGKINLIIVKDLSRFGRNYIQVGQYIDYIFPTYNIRFIALSDNVDTANKDTSAMDMMPIVNLFNEWHAASTSKKIRAVIEANARRENIARIVRLMDTQKEMMKIACPLWTNPPQAWSDIYLKCARRALAPGTLPTH